jgi:uracil-DNA glycosylase family 4
VAPATDDVIAALDALREEVECCSGCVLGATRTKAVFGEGDPGADLMFVGEAPGYHEDQQGRPFVGQAGKLLEQLLASIGMTREQVYIANVLKSRPPNNRDPRPEEIDACRPYLFRQIEVIKPKVICTLGNFATKLLTGDPTGITKVHGRPKATEIAGHPLYLYPIFHPAAALYTPAMLTTLKEDFSRLPQLMAHAAPGPGEEAPELSAVPPAAAEAAPVAAPAAPEATFGPSIEEMARITLGATPIDEDSSASGSRAPRPEPESAAPQAAPPESSAPEPQRELAQPDPAHAPEPAQPEPADDPPAPPAEPADPAPAPAPEPPRAPAAPPAEPEQLGLF